MIIPAKSQFNNLKMKIVLLTRTGLEISVHLIQKVRKKYTLLVQMNLTGTTSTHKMFVFLFLLLTIVLCVLRYTASDCPLMSISLS
jgi:hypothetical protein